ncbi:40S ribosomal protein S27-like [Labeo rohita]|uniref:40S ribosomal protein S27 n=1 Tax=Labeo rohita TaxID=84645 RepID=A0ABQ8LS11_LABRO|nr:40S ribosomal protein S27-like [Labeo rohita]
MSAFYVRCRTSAHVRVRLMIFVCFRLELPFWQRLNLRQHAKERRRHKKKRLVQSPNSYFMDVKCPGCYKITTVFSHAQTVVLCVGCSTVLCQPTGGKARLTEGQLSGCATILEGVPSEGSSIKMFSGCFVGEREKEREREETGRPQ